MKYYYYQSSVLAHGLKSKAGFVERVPAAEIERLVAAAVQKHCRPTESAQSEVSTTVRAAIHRIEVLRTTIKLTIKQAEDDTTVATLKTLELPWTKPSNTRKREILSVHPLTISRPIRTKARTRLLKGIAQGRKWFEIMLNI